MACGTSSNFLGKKGGVIMDDAVKRGFYATGAAVSALAPMAAFAEGETSGTIDAVKTSVTGMATTVQTNVLDVIAAVLPVAAVVIAAVLVATKGVSLVKRFMGR